MEFSRWDFTIIIVMSFAVITMSFVFPALGLTGENTTTSDVPEYNSTVDQYRFRGDFPNNPGSPSKGVMHWNERQPSSEPSQAIWLDGGTQDGVELAVVNTGNVSDPQMEVFIQNWTNGAGVSEDSVVLQNTTDYGQVTYNDWKVTVHWDRKSNVGTENFTAEVDFTVNQEPSDVAWYGRVPVVGGIIDAGNDLAAIVGWIGSILYWLMGTAVSIIWQTFALLLDVLTFGIDMMHWLLVGYFSIVDGASSWASVFVLVPGIALFLEFAKLSFIGIDLIWFG